jgi:hypothetical protein
MAPLRWWMPPTKIARKRHENQTSYKKEIDATMKASIHSEVNHESFRTLGGQILYKPVKNLNL